MSFRQIFDRINRIARAGVSSSGPSGDYQDALRHARDLIEETRRRDRGETEADSEESERSTEDTPRSGGEGRMNRERACAILGVSISATMEEISSAYRVRIVAVHPDRLVEAEAERIDQAKRKTQELNEAYSFLKQSARGG